MESLHMTALRLAVSALSPVATLALALTLAASSGCAGGLASDGYQLSSMPTEATPNSINFMGFRAGELDRVSAWANDLPISGRYGGVHMARQELGTGTGGQFIADGEYLFSFRSACGDLNSQAATSVTLGPGAGSAVAVALVDGTAGPEVFAYEHRTPPGLADDEISFQFVNLSDHHEPLDLYQCATRSQTLGKEPDCTRIASGLGFGQLWRETLTINEDIQYAVDGPDGFERLSLAPRSSQAGPPTPTFAAIYYHNLRRIYFYDHEITSSL